MQQVAHGSLKAAAKIEYVGEFTDAGKEVAAPVEKPADATSGSEVAPGV